MSPDPDRPATPGAVPEPPPLLALWAESPRSANAPDDYRPLLCHQLDVAAAADVAACVAVRLRGLPRAWSPTKARS
jgi:hypothetical protein